MARVLQDSIEGLKMARSAIRANPLRSALTMLGIIIGIVTVTLMSAFITGINDMFHQTTSFMGSDVYYVDKMSWNGGDWKLMRNRPNVTLENAAQLRQRMTTAKAISVNADQWGVDVKYKSDLLQGLRASGVDADYETTTSIGISQGRFFATQELVGARPVCIIGNDIWENLFHSTNPIGQTIRVQGYPLEVIGVAKKVGGLFGVFSIDQEVLMPLRTFFNAFGDPDRSLTISVKAKNVLDPTLTKDETAYQMRVIRGLRPSEQDNFAINSQDQFNSAFDQVTTVISVIGLIITGLSLLVGGIGIMNIMFVTVKERTREIGIRKAIGARRRMILTQFLTEAMLLCLVAGGIALLFAYSVAWLINANLLQDSDIKVNFSAGLIVMGLLLSLGIGVLSGLLPAWRASKLDPVDALRYE